MKQTLKIVEKEIAKKWLGNGMNNFADSPEILLERQFLSISDDGVFNENTHIVRSKKLGIIRFETVLFFCYILLFFKILISCKILNQMSLFILVVN